MQNLVKYLKKEEELEQQQKRRKPKLIQLPDPTIFTISSPSAWQKTSLHSPDIVSLEVSFQGNQSSEYRYKGSLPVECLAFPSQRSVLNLSSPQLAADDEDCVNRVQNIRCTTQWQWEISG